MVWPVGALGYHHGGYLDSRAAIRDRARARSGLEMEVLCRKGLVSCERRLNKYSESHFPDLDKKIERRTGMERSLSGLSVGTKPETGAAWLECRRWIEVRRRAPCADMPL